jgi:hypothetical protein
LERLDPGAISAPTATSAETCGVLIALPSVNNGPRRSEVVGQNLAHLDLIPPSGAKLFAGVIPREAGSGGPCRVLAHY